VALLLAAMAGPDPRAPLSAGTHGFAAAPSLKAAVRARRVAWSPSLGGLPVEPDVLSVLVPVVESLADLGLEVEPGEPDLRGADTVFETWRAYQFAAGLGDLFATDGEHMKETLRWSIQRGIELEVADLIAADRAEAELRVAVDAFFARYDYLACPVTQLSPFPIELEYPGEVAGVPMHTYVEWMRSCSRITVTSCPAISVPVGFTAAGLPVGLQLVAPPFAERRLLELAHALEAALGVCDRVPPAVQSRPQPNS
jgi:amidase